MKTILNKTLQKGSILLFCLYGYVAHADDPEPPIDPPPTEDAPINENILILIFIAVLFGIYIIYNHKLNKKRPI